MWKKLSIINIIRFVALVLIFILSYYTWTLYKINTSENFFKYTFYEGVVIFFSIINIVLMIELYNFFSRSLSESEKKDKFIFKVLDEITIDLLKEELSCIRNEEDYKKYLSTNNKIENRMELLSTISKNFFHETICKEIESIKSLHKEYYKNSSEYIQNYEEFNKKKNEFKKAFENINSKIVRIQARILKFTL